MAIFSIGPERRSWGFDQLVLKEFSFLAEQGFVPKDTDPAYVRFESRESFVEVYHGRGSYVVDLEFGLRGDENRFDLRQLARTVGSAIPPEPTPAESPEEMRQAVKELASSARQLLPLWTSSRTEVHDRLRRLS